MISMIPVSRRWGEVRSAATLPRVSTHTQQPQGDIMSDTNTDNETPVLDLLARMTADSLETSTLDAETLILVRVAALVAIGAPPVSYLLNLEAAGEMGIDPEELRGVLAAVAPIVGTARVAAATGNIVKALAVEIEVAELDSQDDV
jgi:alkylhydroperoxidase/carboxymuconolactone decarboxylase family protein YurZ